MRGGAGATGHFLGLQPDEGPLAVALDRRNRVVPGAHLAAVGGGPEPALFAKVGIDVVLAAECPDLGDRGRRGARQPQRLGGPAHPLERLELRPQREDEAAVAPARTGAADVALQEDDVKRRLALLQCQGGPQAGQAASDDADVGPEVAVQRRPFPGRIERLLKPQAACGGCRRAHRPLNEGSGYCRSAFFTSLGATATISPFLIWTSTGAGRVLSWKWSPLESNLIGP